MTRKIFQANGADTFYSFHHSFLFSVAKEGTRFGAHGDWVTQSLLQTFTEGVSCSVNERKHLLLWSFQSSHRLKLITDCDSCLHRCVQGAGMTLCGGGVGEGVSDCTGRREGEKTQSFEGSGWFGKREE